jgi:RNA polymerase sigma-70 factor (ECF subfamily)
MAASNSADDARIEADASPESGSHQQLIDAAAAGDRTALERLLLIEFDAIQQHIARQASQWPGVGVNVEDLLQDTFAQAFRDVGRFDFRSQRSLRAWLCTIADHRLQDHARRQRRQKRGGGHSHVQLQMESDRSSLIELATLISADGDSPSQAAARAEVVRAVHVGVASLPDDQREAVRRRFVERQDYATAAQGMGRSPEAVRSLVNRAKQSLRSFMGRSSRWFIK